MQTVEGATSDDFELPADKGCIRHINKHRMYSLRLLKHRGEFKMDKYGTGTNTH